MSHFTYLDYADMGRFVVQLKLEVPCTDFPQVSTEDIVVYDKVLNRLVPVDCDGVSEAKELIEYLMLINNRD